MTLDQFKAFVRPFSAVFCVFAGIAYVFTLEIMSALGHGPGAKEALLIIIFAKPLEYIYMRSQEKRAGQT